MKKKFLCFLLLTILLPVCHAQTGTFRALLISNAHYDDGRVRLGGLNSAQGMYDCLSRCFGSRGSFISSLAADMEKDALLENIRYTFSEAQDEDVSLLYINAHGGIQNGFCWIETREGDYITPEELEALLRPVPGKIILLVDACNSGGFIGSQSKYADLFSAFFTQNAFASDKYLVITSCCRDEESFRVSSDKAVEKSVATVFTRSFCEGLGWDLINDHSTPLKADANRDRQVDAVEIISYLRRRCMFYLAGSSRYEQSIRFSCLQPQFIFADRNPAKE